MELSELLSELRENILYDRSDRIEGTSDYLWSDVTLVRYINEAQRKLAREAMVIRDGTTTDVARVTLRTGQTHYPLHEAVLSVMSAKLPNEQYDLKRGSHALLDQLRPTTENYFDVNTLTALDPGKPIAWTSDDYLSSNDFDSMGRATLRLHPAPSADYDGVVLELRVIRLPIMALSTTSTCMVPEVPEQYHLPMLDWAAYLALRADDIDAGSEQKAEMYRRKFAELVRQARKETIQKMRAPQTWGFGQNGFRWES